MSYHKVIKNIALLSIMFFVLPHLAIAYDAGQIFLIEKGPIVQSTLYADGSVIGLQTETITLPIINSDMTNVNLAEFERMVRIGRQNFEMNPNKKIISGDGPTRGLDIVFNVTNSPGPDADSALARSARYVESVYDDPITVTINMNFADLPAGVLGWTSVTYAGYVTWTNTRSGLISDMDADDSIQTYMPSGATIPVRYNGSSSTVTNENRCRFTRANYNAAIGAQAGTAATIEYNTDYNSLWDWDPSNGVGGGNLCFMSVVIHEIGHVLGFTSRAESWYDPNSDIDALDIFRFQRTDGAGDYNPDNLSEFGTTARLVDYNNPNDDHNSDVIADEYRMEDGNPNQASHFRTSVYALMDPNLGYGETFYPDFYKTPDLTMFDAIGWDYTEVPTYTLNINTVGNGSVTKDPDYSAYPESTEVELTADPDPGWTFDQWSGDLTGSNNPDTILMDDNKSVTATFTQDQYTLTVNTVGNGSVTKNPNQPFYVYGDDVALTANPDPGWEFDHWSGGLTGSNNPDTITITGNTTVTAHFVEAQYTLDINIDGGGSVVVNPSQAFYGYGDTVELLAEPDTGWNFDHWSGNLTGNNNPDTIIMDDDKTVTAHFTQNQYTLDITIDGNGSVTADPSQTYYTYGEEVELLAEPDSGWSFDQWSGDLSGSNNPDTILIDTNKAVTAHFTQNQYTLDIIIDGSGSVTLNPDQTYYVYGDEVEVLATADSGWVFDHWSGDLSGSNNPDTVFIDDNKTVTAHFIEEQYVEEGERMEKPFIDIFPNPSSNIVNIKFGIGQSINGMELKIYNVTGQLVKEFACSTPDALCSTHLTWNSKDNTGRKVSSGVYILKYTAGDYEEIEKLLLLK